MIGVLTFHRGPNYGGFLQAWHLKEAIRSLGHQVTVVNYQNPVHHQAEKLQLPGPTLKSLKTFAHRYLKKRPFHPHVAGLSDHPFTTRPETIEWNRFSTVVVGSDVVWDHSHPVHGNEPAYFGSLRCQHSTRFISYAASCGETTAGATTPAFVLEGIRRFSRHLVRDENTAGLVNAITGTMPQIVADPTWLQDDPPLPYRYAPTEPYILLYGGGINPQRGGKLRDYCDSNRLKLYTACTPCRFADKVLRSMDPFEWVDLFRHASGVVTSTLHGTLYTIKYRKPLVLMNNPQTANKARTVIEHCQLGDSVFEEGEDFTASRLTTLLDPSRKVEPPAEMIQASIEALAEALTTRHTES